MTKEGMTLEKLARMVQEGFGDTATKRDIHEIVRHLDALDLRLSAYASLWRDEFEALEDRVKLLETVLEKR